LGSVSVDPASASVLEGLLAQRVGDADLRHGVESPRRQLLRGDPEQRSDGLPIDRGGRHD
jgi:hypothetical protein